MNDQIRGGSTVNDQIRGGSTMNDQNNEGGRLGLTKSKFGDNAGKYCVEGSFDNECEGGIICLFY